MESLTAAGRALAMRPLQIVFSFDTTGSMSRALDEVRKHISDMLKKFKRDLPAMTIAIIAHGDYCDREIYGYVIKHIDFTNDHARLEQFVKEVSPTGGGDTPEAYEVMLRLVRTGLSWREGTQKVLVVIGDSYPHPPDYKLNKDKIDWEEEVRLLARMGVKIYGVQFNDDEDSTRFFKAIIERTKGFHLPLEDFSSICDVLTAVCRREQMSLSTFRTFMDERRRHYGQNMPTDIETVFALFQAFGDRPDPATVRNTAQITQALRDAGLFKDQSDV